MDLIREITLTCRIIKSKTVAEVMLLFIYRWIVFGNLQVPFILMVVSCTIFSTRVDQIKKYNNLNDNCEET